MSQPPATPALETRGLTKHFLRHVALESLDLAIMPGSAFALLGRNGAGKSTLLKILLGLLPPTRGEARVLGKDARNLSEVDRRQIGYVADGQDLPSWMTVDAYLAFLRPLYPTWDDVFCKKLLSIFDLPMARKLRHLSRGQRAKTALLGALAHHPRLLLLDEPFGGLDPAVREEIIAALVELMNREEWTIVISSHEIDEVERLADRVAILDAGRLVLDEEKDKLLDRCRAVSLLSDRGLNGKPPPSSWWNLQQAQGRVTFLESAHDPAKLEPEIHQIFPDAGHVQIDPAPLKTICLAILRQPVASQSSVP